FFYTPVVNSAPTGKSSGTGPQWVVRRWDKDLIAVIEQSLQHHRNHFRNAVANKDVVAADVHDAFGLVVLRYRSPSRGDAFRVRVTLRQGQLSNHSFENFVWGCETKGGRVANVEPHNALTGRF